MCFGLFSAPPASLFRSFRLDTDSLTFAEGVFVIQRDFYLFRRVHHIKLFVIKGVGPTRVSDRRSRGLVEDVIF